MNNWISYLLKVSGEVPDIQFLYPTPFKDIYLFVEIGDPDNQVPSIGLPAIGGWQLDGASWGPINTDAYQEIRPFGNNPDGTATDPLDLIHLSGFCQRITGTAGRAYPSGLNPFDLDVRRKEFTGTYAGHGWRAEMAGGVKDRAPGVRAVGLYSDQECTAYLYTTGAFIEGLSDWQLDGAGNPINVWYTETPPGQVTPEETAIHMAVLSGSIQEGHQTLEEDHQRMQYQFWDRDQPAIVDPGEWHDTGAKVVALEGTLYRVDDGVPFSDMAPGTPLKFTENGAETTFVSIWAGSTDLVQIDPYVAAVIGDAVWANN